MDHTNEMQLIFDSRSSNESFARVTVAAFMTSLNPTVEEVSDVKTAVSEAVTNAIIHGYEGEVHNICIRCRTKEQTLFVEIEDVDVEEDEQKEAFFLSMKVYGKTMMQHDISNGMLKTIYYIVELYTMASDSLVLIDEFENGLGVNCIDLLSDLLLTEREDLQFIITSHHPKIINSIGKEKWRIIDRDGSRVVNSDCTKYGIGNSQHDAYYNLINRWEFEGKI